MLVGRGCDLSLIYAIIRAIPSWWRVSAKFSVRFHLALVLGMNRFVPMWHLLIWVFNKLTPTRIMHRWLLGWWSSFCSCSWLVHTAGTGLLRWSVLMVYITRRSIWCKQKRLAIGFGTWLRKRRVLWIIGLLVLFWSCCILGPVRILLELNTNAKSKVNMRTSNSKHSWSFPRLHLFPAFIVSLIE